MRGQRPGSRLAAGTSLATLSAMIAAMPQPARADGFLATPTVQSGSVTFNRTPLNSETITLDSTRAVINWTPYDNTGTGDVVLQPTGNSTSFQAGSALISGGQNYVVLNRIIAADPSRRIYLDGLVQDLTGGNNGVFFYAPGGFLIGPNATFNVSRLLLSAGDLTTDVSGEFFPGSNSFTVNGAVDSQAAINILPGAQFNATAENSFVVAVAPQILQNGAITVNGSAALVAAESASFTINAGLFDINVTSGTSVSAQSAFDHTGSTTGPASGGAGDYHRIYMVAVPKNDAIAMSIRSGGTVGFDVAGAANMDGNAIVLSAGYNVSDTASGNPISTQAGGPGTADVFVSAGNYTSGIYGKANNMFRIADDTTNVNRDISLAGYTNIQGRSVSFAANAGTVSVDADLDLIADYTNPVADGLSIGGNAQISVAAGAILNVQGDVLASANGIAQSVNPSGNGGAAGGGLAQFFSAGTTNFTGDLVLDATATGGTGINGGNATGGSARVDFTAGVTTIGGQLVVRADAFGGTGTDPMTGNGGNATGGQAQVNGTAGGQFTAAQGLTQTTIADAGDGDLSTGLGGSATGGTVSLSLVGNSQFTVPGLNNVYLDASAAGGSGATGGNASGGGAQMFIANSTLAVSSFTEVYAYSLGGLGYNGDGGDALGVDSAANILLNGTATGPASQATFADSVNLYAYAVGGGALGSTGNGGDAVAGSTVLNATVGNISIAGDTAFLAYASAGAGINGGVATGGTVGSSINRGTLTVGADTFAGVYASGGDAAEGFGGAGGEAIAGGANFTAFSHATGGSAINLGVVTVDASAAGGAGGSGFGGSAGGIGGNATAGGANLLAQAANGQFTATSIDLNLTAQGGLGGAGGTGSSGAGGAGGAGGSAFGGGTNTGTASGIGATTTTGYFRVPSVAINSNADGGAGGNGGDGPTAGGAGGAGGAATAGNSVLLTRGSEVTVSALTLAAVGRGGDGGAGGNQLGLSVGADGQGGDGQGGSATVLSSAHFVTFNPANTTIDNVVAIADGIGGASVAGVAGGGRGGTASIQLNLNGTTVPDSGTVVITGIAQLSARGQAGQTTSGQGGVGTGGSTLFEAVTGSITVGSSVTMDSFGAGTSPLLFGVGTPGIGGIAEFRVDGGSLDFGADVSAYSDGFGGFSLSPGGGGFGQGGSTMVSFLAGGGNVRFRGPTQLYSLGSGGSGDNPAGGADATGGTVSAVAANGGTLQFDSSLVLLANGSGGSIANNGDGGPAQGGTINLGSQGGNAIFGSFVQAYADADGGDTPGGIGGAAQAGTINVMQTGAGTMQFAQDLQLYARATGGAGSVVGGAATGGNITVYADAAGGAMTVGNAVTAVANASGGAATGAGSTGGAATGGFVQLRARDGNLTVNGTNLSALGLGGSGASGGAGTGGRTSLLANGTGTLTSLNLNFLTASGVGGDALFGFGGTGGAATGGRAFMSADVSPGSGTLIATSDNSIDASAFGGRGGTGAAGQVGGTGGAAIGGMAQTGSGSQGGSVTLGNTLLVALGYGGDGGDGGNGATGGTGGTGTGGLTGAGNENVAVSAVGSYNWTSIEGDASGRGGLGGAGGSGAAGGAGGAAFGGASNAGIFGGTMTVAGDLSLKAEAQGGDGGTGTTAGAGGAGTGGRIIVSADPHSNGSAGSFTSGQLVGSAGAVGGAGATTGPSIGGYATLTSFSSTITTGDLALLSIADAGPAGTNIFGGTASGLAAVNGQINVNGFFIGSFTGNASIGASNGGIRTTGNLLLDGANILSSIGTGTLGTNGTIQSGGFVNIEATVGSLTTGTAISGDGIRLAAVNSISAAGLTSAADLTLLNTLGQPVGTATIAAGDIQAAGPITVSGSGAYTIGKVSSADLVSITSTEGLTVGDIDAGDYILLFSNGPLSAGNMTAASYVDISANGNLNTGSIRAESDVDLAASGNIVAGNLSSGDSVSLLANGTITAGNLDAGIVNRSADIDAAWRLGVSGGGAVSLGTVQAYSDIGLHSDAAGIQAGAITSQTGVVVGLARTDSSFGAITTATGASGGVLLADSSMISLLGTTFDTGALFAATPVASAGSFTVTGPVSTALFKAAAGTSLTVQGALSATDIVNTLSGGTSSFNAITAAGPIDLVSGSTLTTGAIRGDQDVSLVAAANVTTANVSAGDAISITSTAGTIAAGNVDAGIVNRSTDPAAAYRIGLFSAGGVNAGNVQALSDIGAFAQTGNVQLGNVSSQQGSFAALARGSITAADITTATAGTVLLADASMISLLPPSFDTTALFAATPVRAGGAIQVGGVQTGELRAASAGNFTAQGAINAGRAVGVNSGGVVSFNGAVSAPAITITSADINLGAAGALGTAATQTLLLNIDQTASAATIGGTGAAGYALDGAEAAKLRAATIIVNATALPANRAVTLGAMTLTGALAGQGANLAGQNGTFALLAQGNVRVSGAVAFDQLGQGNRVSIATNGRVEIATDQGGGIALSNGTLPAGALSVVGTDLWVGTADLLSRLAADVNFAGRNAIIDGLPTVARPEGAVQGGSIALSATRSILIQNTGGRLTRGGFTFGSGGLTIGVPVNAQGQPIQQTPIDVVINGRGTTDGSSFTINGDVRGLLTLRQGLTGLSTGSSVNGCLFTAENCAPVVDEMIIQTAVETSTNVEALADQDDDPVDETQPDTIEARISTLINTQSMTADDPVTEPITGSGNSGLWLGKSTDDGEIDGGNL